MLFNSLEYVLFLLLVFALFWASVRARVLRTVVLLVASYVFYMSWNATFILLIVASTVLDYRIGLLLHSTEKPRVRKWLVSLSLAGNLGALGLFKYYDFFAESVSDGMAALGLGVGMERLELVLPVGISFYTFQTLSYTIDIYRGTLKPTRSFLEFATFVAFFPQLVAGPIVRARELLPQFDQRPVLGLDRVGDALFLLLRGMAKKILIADFLAANIIDRVWDDPGAYSSSEVWLAVFAYTWQLYGDFSGYTDIARGSAKLFGFELPENFKRPFAATGPIEFWNRWHITLSTWVRDYVYIPLGGSKLGPVRTYVNLFIAFLLTGIWHGAGWTFVIFGTWHGLTVALNRLWRDLRGKQAPPSQLAHGLMVAGNLSLYVFHWPMFRSPNVQNMMDMYRRMFAGDWTSMRVDPWVLAVIVGFTAVHMSPPRWLDHLRVRLVRMPAPAQALVLVAAAGLLVWVGSAQEAPFIYFQF